MTMDEHSTHVTVRVIELNIYERIHCYDRAQRSGTEDSDPHVLYKFRLTCLQGVKFKFTDLLESQNASRFLGRGRGDLLIF